MTRENVNLIRSLFLGSTLFLVLAVACIPVAEKAQKEPIVEPPSKVAPLPEKEVIKPSKIPIYYTHTVKWRGESLSIISKWYTGDIRNWKTIAQHNPEMDPNQIRIGDRIIIPDQLMQNKTPLKKAYVDRHQTKPVGRDAPSDAPSREGTPELFGPKEFRED